LKGVVLRGICDGAARLNTFDSADGQAQPEGPSVGAGIRTAVDATVAISEARESKPKALVHSAALHGAVECGENLIVAHAIRTADCQLGATHRVDALP
jgi:hypothetical protein